MNFLKSRKVVYFGLASLFAFYGIIAIAIPLILELPLKSSPNWWHIFSDEYWTSYYYVFISGFISLGISFITLLTYTLNLKPVYKHCSLCNTRYLGIFDKASKLTKLINLNEYNGPFHNTLCPKCWKSLTQRKCSFCGKPFYLMESKTEELLANYKAHSIKAISAIKYVCPSCYKMKILANCDKCGNSYPKLSNKKSQYYKNQEISKFLYPFHIHWSPNWKSLCPSCYNLCCKSVEEVKNQLNSWVSGTTEDHIDYYRIDEDLGQVEVSVEKGCQKNSLFDTLLISNWGDRKPQSNFCLNKVQVEEKLKLYTIQKGGNAYINCNFNRRTVKQIKQSYKDNHKLKPVLQKEVLSTKTYYGGSALAIKVRKSVKKDDSHHSHRGISLAEFKEELCIIDGSNICRYNSEHNQNGEFILCHILSLCNLLSDSNIKYRCYFDANVRHNIPELSNETDLPIYISMLNEFKEIFFEAPGKSDADAFILQDAKHNNAYIITNDHYREYHEQHPWVQNGDRLVKFMINNDTIIIPDLNIYFKLILDSSIAFNRLSYSFNMTKSNLSIAK